LGLDFVKTYDCILGLALWATTFWLAQVGYIEILETRVVKLMH